ncbi:uncharacterized protein K452DRAFT_13985 [Aplosporella prunicola CBS 121167]|uniref:Uncharacterized protein n=1 Tax=Aplosporella prunicola CBS 121167 TaxID=1176127 RepID=A0A6A6BHB6_9PEZI|nr:uncharacterized protein K452DRAFT_13985 [Aplosporella prunicola CBS 121167]KAF2142988.1 hypothetical protein K452DRAFT_13985 [Aplosporella prunicola CBS 121167]
MAVSVVVVVVVVVVAAHIYAHYTRTLRAHTHTHTPWIPLCMYICRVLSSSFFLLFLALLLNFFCFCMGFLFVACGFPMDNGTNGWHGIVWMGLYERGRE